MIAVAEALVEVIRSVLVDEEDLGLEVEILSDPSVRGVCLMRPLYRMGVPQPRFR